MKTNYRIVWLIDWCLTPTLAVFQLYRGVIKLLFKGTVSCKIVSIKSDYKIFVYRYGKL